MITFVGFSSQIIDHLIEHSAIHNRNLAVESFTITFSFLKGEMGI